MSPAKNPYEASPREVPKATDQLEERHELVEKALSSIRYVVHGNSSRGDMQRIVREGLRVTEGRATVSTNLAHAYDWAVSSAKRDAFSRSPTQREEGETGGIVVVAIPEEHRVGLGTFTDIMIDEENKTISGDPLKYASGSKQLGIYSTPEVEQRKRALEDQRLAERPTLTVAPGPDHFPLLIEPGEKSGEIIAMLDKKAKAFEKVNIEEVSTQILEQISEREQVDPEVIRELVRSSIESIVVSRIRNLAMDVKRARGFRIYNKGEETPADRPATVESVKSRLSNLKALSSQEDFDLGIEWLNAYVRANVEKLDEELQGDRSTPAAGSIGYWKRRARPVGTG
jgi:hypothetical protein